jgi:putative membrane protein
MGPEYYWMHGMWVFPVVMPNTDRPGAGGLFDFRSRHSYEGGQSLENALDILKKRYVKGEITREEFEQMKKDILS